MKTSSPLTIIAIVTAADGQEETLRAAQEILVAETLSEPGCLSYELHQSLDDPRILIFTESWATEDHWKAHMEGAAVLKFQASPAAKLVQDFTLHRMAPVAG